jgi:Glycosyltransferase family 87
VSGEPGASAGVTGKLGRFLPVYFLAVCVLFALDWRSTFAPRIVTPDFSVFWAAARLALERPDLLYNDAAVTLKQVGAIGLTDGIRPWAYPPTAVLPLLPFGQLPYATAFPLFAILSFALFLVSTRHLFDRGKPLAMALVALAQPVLFGALNGQMIMIVAAMIITALIILPAAPIRAGVLFGIAATIKPQLLVLAPLAMLADRQYRALGASLCAGAGMILLSLMLGPERWTEWLAALPRFKDTVESLGILGRNITPTGILWFLGVTGRAQLMANLVFGLAGGWMVWRVFRWSNDVPTRLVALAGGALFAAPYAMNYDLALLVPAAAAFLVQGIDRRASLTSMLASGLVIIVDGWLAPWATMLFIVVITKDFIWPGKMAGSTLAWRVSRTDIAMPTHDIAMASAGR